MQNDDSEDELEYSTAPGGGAKGGPHGAQGQGGRRAAARAVDSDEDEDDEEEEEDEDDDDVDSYDMDHTGGRLCVSYLQPSWLVACHVPHCVRKHACGSSVDPCAWQAPYSPAPDDCCLAPLPSPVCPGLRIASFSFVSSALAHSPGKSLERPSQTAIRAAEALAVGRALAGEEAAVRFQVGVGRGCGTVGL